MQYLNGKDVLPDHLLEALQEYVNGCMIYIPSGIDRIGWGEKSGTKSKLAMRNSEIHADYVAGISIKELSQKHFLSESSIRKIVKS
ncbi:MULTISPECIES: CD3324 family protein [unclassified Fusibacter]|uniref:CD3324 family protein n=1 Tax=unclassified Fusibacter TaxID=2624464 RepID=UPI0010104100|nr:MULTISPECIES: CD3324 family protein [unclassified Fusibacter]MCK8061440.1 CD3324 family protein [Fusibacter sp. A2]NPE23627.1 DNA-binding response regulator [Fusibacter sp. A1]RXV58900.1 DNA-binding response regulator [Fusibacter sp. A1]